MSSLSTIVGATAVGFGFATLLTPLCRRLARALGVVARPHADRWHRDTVALLGGVALYSAWILSVMGLGLWRVPLVPTLIGGATVLFAVGLVDDLRPLGPQSKFIVQVLVAAVMAALGLQLHLTRVPLLDLLITLFWMVGITNAFNLLDNMDGLAAGVAAITIGFRLIFFLMDGNLAGAALSAALLGVTLGFLVYNFNPASIFMGDAGSLFLGFTVSGLSLIGGYPYSRGTLSVLLFPALLLMVPIFDTALVTIARMVAGRRISQGGRDHASHRLVALGLTERRAVLLLYVVALASGFVSLLSYRYGLSYAVVVIALMLIGLGLLGVLLGRIAVYPDDTEAARANGKWIRLLTDFPHKRQVATAMIDLTLIVIAYYSAYLLRFEETFRAEEVKFIESLPVVIVCQMCAFALFRTYQGVWRYTSLNDLVRLANAALAGTVLAVLVLLFGLRFAGYSRAVFVLDALLLLVLVGGSRLFFRALAERLRPRPDQRRRVLIYGAGDGGVLTLREILNNPRLGRLPVGFVDDDRSKQHAVIQGVPVLCGIDRLGATIRQHDIAEVIVASSLLAADNRERLERVCDEADVQVVQASMRLE